MIDCIKLDGGELGVINLNNVIPVNNTFLTKVNIPPKNERHVLTKEEQKYLKLLDNQLEEINSPIISQ